MNITLFLSIFAILGSLYLWIGYKTSQKITTLEDYFLGSRNFGTFALTIALMATHIGGGAILGTSVESYLFGWYGFMYMGGIALGLLLLASGIAVRMQRLSIATTAEIFETAYGSPALRKYASLLSLFSLSGILVAQIIGSRNLLASLDLYSDTLFWVFWLVVIAYTVMGGLRAIVANDIFQLSFIIALFSGLFLFDILSNPAQASSIIMQHASFALPATFTWSRFLTILLLPALYCLIEQDIAQTIFSARSATVAFKGSLYAALGLITFTYIPFFFGIKAKFLNLALPTDANPLLFYFDRFYPSIIVTLVAYGICAAIISTGNALLCAISSHVVQDFINPQQNSALLYSHITTIFIGLSCMLLATHFSNIIDVMVNSYAIPVCILIVPLVGAYFISRPSQTAAYASIFVSTFLFVGFKVFSVTLPAPELIIILCTCILYGLISVISKKYLNKNY